MIKILFQNENEAENLLNVTGNSNNELIRLGDTVYPM